MHFTKAFVALAAPFLLTSAAPAYKRAVPLDALVVKFALALNQLESAFYDEALTKFKAADFLTAGFSAAEIPLEQYKTVSTDEKAHIAFLQSALKAIGDVPVAGCKFDFSSVLGDVTTMAAVSRVLENVGVGAFIGAASLLTDKNILGAAAGVVSIESRHSSIANVLNGGSSIPQAFDVGLSPASVLALAGGFISGCDFGIPANAPLTITTKGATVGSKLTFTSPGIDKAVAAKQSLSCQILTGGDAVSKSFPIDNCVIPANIDGPVYIYITNSAKELPVNPQQQCTDCIAAGPALIFVDTQPQALGNLVRTSGAAGKAIAAGAPATGSTTGTSGSTSNPQQDNSKAGGSSPSGVSGFDGNVVVHDSFSIPRSGAPAASSSGSAGTGGKLVLPTGADLSPVPKSA